MSPYDGLMTPDGSSCRSTPSASTAAASTPNSSNQEDMNDDGRVMHKKVDDADDERCEEKREQQSSSSILFCNSFSSKTSTTSSSYKGAPKPSYTGTPRTKEEDTETQKHEDQESWIKKCSPITTAADAADDPSKDTCPRDEVEDRSLEEQESIRSQDTSMKENILNSFSSLPLEPITSSPRKKEDTETKHEDQESWCKCSPITTKDAADDPSKDTCHREEAQDTSMEDQDSGTSQDTSMEKNILHLNVFSTTPSSSPLKPTTSAPRKKEEPETKQEDHHESCKAADDPSALKPTTSAQLEEEPETEPTTCTRENTSTPPPSPGLVEKPIEKSATSFTPRGVLTSASTSGDSAYNITDVADVRATRKPKKQVTFLSRPRPHVKLSPSTSPRSPRLSQDLGTTPSYSSKHTRTRSPLPRLDQQKKDEDEDDSPRKTKVTHPSSSEESKPAPSSREELMRKPLTIPLRPHAAFPISKSIVSYDSSSPCSPSKNRENLLSQDSSSGEKGRSVPFKKPKDFPEGEEFTIGPRIAQIETKLLSLDEKTLRQFDVVNSRGRKTKRSNTAPAAASKLEDDWWGTSSAPSDHNGSDSEVMCEFFAIGTPTGSRARASSVCSLGSLYSTRSSRSSRSMKSMRSFVSTGSIYKDSSAGSIYSDEGSLYGDES